MIHGIKILITGFFFAAAIIFNFAECSAENLKFVDAAGDVGYYVDSDSVKIISPEVFDVDIITIRVELNQMEVTDVRINHAAKTYTIKSTKTLSYDERTELKSDNVMRKEKSYSDKSFMADAVGIILHGGD